MDLTKIKTYYICLDEGKYKKRKKYVEALLEKTLGFVNIIHYKPEGLGECIDLKKAALNILSENMNDEPILIVEDDIFPYSNPAVTSIEIPDNSDCMYLGFHKFGIHPTDNKLYKPLTAISYNETQYRIYNTMSSHSILYITKKFKRTW